MFLQFVDSCHNAIPRGEKKLSVTSDLQTVKRSRETKTKPCAFCLRVARETDCEREISCHREIAARYIQETASTRSMQTV